MKSSASSVRRDPEKARFSGCLNRLEAPTEGEIYLDDVLIEESNINEVRTKMGMVFQNFNLFPHKSVLENITLAPVKVKKEDPKTAAEEAVELLKKVGLADKKDSYPDELSGGQKQRVGYRQSTGDETGGHAFRRADFRSRSGDGRRSSGSNERACRGRHDYGYRHS